LSKRRSGINNLCLLTRPHQLDSINFKKYSKTCETQSVFAVIASFSFDLLSNEVKHD